jgi:hypothetical protein
MWVATRPLVIAAPPSRTSSRQNPIWIVVWCCAMNSVFCCRSRPRSPAAGTGWPCTSPPSDPPAEEWAHHPVIVAFVDEFRRAQDGGVIPAEVYTFHNTVAFLVGLYAPLITMPDSGEIRTPFIDQYLTTHTYGLRAV